MNICKFCKDKGFTKEEYLNFKNNITVVAAVIRSQLSYNGGMYYDTNKILKNYSNPDMKYFIIQELKKMNVEFVNNNSMYRVV